MPEFQPTVLFEDADILVLNKPAGLVVNQADSVKAYSLQDWLATQVPVWQKTWISSEWEKLVPADFALEFGSPEKIYAERLGLCHRLDKDTSGCLVIAKNPGALVQMLKQFRERKIKKSYLCLVHGGFTVLQGEINAPIARSEYNRTKFAVDVEGRVAITTYEVKRRFVGLKGLVEAAKLGWSHQAPEYQAFEAKFLELPVAVQKKIRQHKSSYEQGFSLVACYPKTGRTHQIRVHMAHIHHPLVGDQLYAGKKRASVDAYWCPRQFLHAATLEFTHPRTIAQQQIEAPLPTQLAEILEYLVEV
jgi:23S rRNA pseudouridine1911/1915/1917 synthase